MHIPAETAGENVFIYIIYVKPELVLRMFLHGCARAINITNQPRDPNVQKIRVHAAYSEEDVAGSSAQQQARKRTGPG